MYAIIATGGKQIRVEEGRFVDVELLTGSEGDAVSFDEILMISKDGQLQVGQPTVPNAKVSGKIVKHGKGPKLIVYKMRPKKHYRKKNGHRQPFTRVMIETIQF